ETSFDRLENRFLRSHDVTKAIIREFSTLSRRLGIRFVVAGIDKTEMTREMLAYCADSGVAAAVDISVDLTLRDNTNLPHDPHPGPRATNQYAENLSAFLRKHVLRFSPGQTGYSEASSPKLQ